MENKKVLKHFGLKRDPFMQAHDSGDVYRSRGYRERMEQLFEWAGEGQLCCVIGAIGTGKTTFLDDCEGAASATGELELINLGFPDREKMTVSNTVYPAVCQHLRGLGYTKLSMPRDNQSRHIWLKSLLGRTLADRRFAVVIDEAHRLSAKFLRGLKELTELRFGGGRPLMGIVLSGHPSLLSHLDLNAPDVLARVQVGRKIIEMGLEKAEIQEYLRRRCGRAGNSRVFHYGAAAIMENCARTFLDVNELAWSGMRRGYALEHKQVTGKDVLGGQTLRDKMRHTGVTIEYVAGVAGMSPNVTGDVLAGRYALKTKGKYEERLNEALDGILEGRVEPGIEDAAFGRRKGQLDSEVSEKKKATG